MSCRREGSLCVGLLGEELSGVLGRMVALFERVPGLPDGVFFSFRVLLGVILLILSIPQTGGTTRGVLTYVVSNWVCRPGSLGAA